jgi:hypothetical protein
LAWWGGVEGSTTEGSSLVSSVINQMSIVAHISFIITMGCHTFHMACQLAEEFSETIRAPSFAGFCQLLATTKVGHICGHVTSFTGILLFLWCE